MESQNLNSGDLCFVFVHIASAIPKHLELNLIRTLKMFPHIRTYLIGDVEPVYIQDKNFEFFHYKRSNRLSKIFEDRNLDSKFRNGFWDHTLERLFALVDFHQSNSSLKILHIESDVILLPDFPLQIFRELENPSWLSHNEDEDIATLLFLPSAKYSRKFGDLAEGFLMADPNITDMLILKKISRGLEPKFTRMRSPREDSEGIFHGGAFDPLAIGMWMTGQDPRNLFGFTQIHGREIIDANQTLFDPALYSYFLNEKFELKMKKENKSLPIWNLHIHSKNLKLFAEDWESELENFVAKTKYDKIFLTFNLKILGNLLYQNFKAKTLFRYLSHIPVITRLIKLIRNFLRNF